MTGFMILAFWLCLAVIFVLFGKLCDSKVLLSIGAVMILMMAMANDVTY